MMQISIDRNQAKAQNIQVSDFQYHADLPGASYINQYVLTIYRVYAQAEGALQS